MSVITRKELEMIGFKSLKHLILKSCNSNNSSENINDMIHFTIDCKKLESILAQHTDLHVMAFSNCLESKTPDVRDLQLITEYVKNKEEVDMIYDGKTQVCFFMLYCTKEGSLAVEAMTDHGYSKVNEELDEKLIETIASGYPVYRAMIIRRFNEDKFNYSIYFRSNYQMICYIKDLKDQGKFDASNEE